MGSDGSREGGTTAVEFAILLPAFLMFTLGVLDCGRLLWSHAMLERSVSSAARCAAINASLCGTALAIQNHGAGQAWGLGLAASAFTVSPAACGTQVVGRLTFQFVIPWFYGSAPYGSGNSVLLTAAACNPA